MAGRNSSGAPSGPRRGRARGGARGGVSRRLVFSSPTGPPLRHSHFRQRAWLKALSAAGLADFHFYDLRHSGNTLAEGWRIAPRADGQNGARQRACGDDLPAHTRQRCTPAPDRGLALQARPSGAEAGKHQQGQPDHRTAIGHATGTKPKECLLTIISAHHETCSDRRIWVSASSRALTWNDDRLTVLDVARCLHSLLAPRLAPRNRPFSAHSRCIDRGVTSMSVGRRRPAGQGLAPQTGAVPRTYPTSHRRSTPRYGAESAITAIDRKSTR